MLLAGVASITSALALPKLAFPPAPSPMPSPFRNICNTGIRYIRRHIVLSTPQLEAMSEHKIGLITGTHTPSGEPSLAKSSQMSVVAFALPGFRDTYVVLICVLLILCLNFDISSPSSVRMICDS